MNVGDRVSLAGGRHQRYTVLAFCENPRRVWLGHLEHGLVRWGHTFVTNVSACIVDTKPL